MSLPRPSGVSLSVLAALGLSCTVQPALAEQVSTTSAANMAVNCFSCHGPEGHSPGSIPSLAPLDDHTIEAMLLAFKSGERQSSVMQRHAKGYTDAEIKALSKYLGSLK